MAEVIDDLGPVPWNKMGLHFETLNPLKPNLSFSIRDKHLLHKSALEEEIREINV